MSSRVLLESLSEIGDVPERVVQLRKLIVALAISGKFEADEGALNIFELANLVDQRQTAPRTQDRRSLIPDSFRCVPLGSLAKIEKGKTGIKQALPGPFPLVVTAAERGSCDHYDFDGAAAIVPLVSSAGHGKASLNRLHYQEGRFALGTILAAIFPLDPRQVSARFLFEYLSAFKDELLVTRMTGTANVTLTVSGIADVPVPVVSPRAQTKVDELMALCDRLEAARAEREAMRDRLAAASLARLSAPDPKTFQADACFALDALPALTARSDQIKQLRQTILNLAVRGRLVPQDPSDEPALEYLHRVRELRLEEKKILTPIDLDIAGQELPASWIWVHLGIVVRSMDAGWSPQCENRPRSNESQWAVLKTTAVQTFSFDASQNKVLPTKLAPRPQHQAVFGDILVTRAGPKNRVGVSCVVDVPCPRLMISDKLIRFHPIGDISSRYLALTLNAGHSYERLEAAKSGMAVMQMNISQDKLRAIPIPLPPVAEQHRIVAKVDELTALFNRLEASLTTGNDTRRRLLDALLAEALVPAESRTEKAA